MQVVIHQFDGTSTLRVLPLAAGLMASAARAAGFRAEIQHVRRRPEAVVADYDAPDVVAFSLYTWNERYSTAVARLARERLPDALLLAGGPSVPRRDESLSTFFVDTPFDAVVLGEGEETFPELLHAYAAHRDLAGVAGVVRRDTTALGGFRRGPPRHRLADFSAVPSPYLDGTFEVLFRAHPERFGAAVLETNRGCPFACTFCDWGQATQSRVHELPFERVAAELDWVARSGFGYLYIVDANFGIRPRDIEIIEHLARTKAVHGGPGFCYFHLTKNAKAKNLRTVERLLAAGIQCQVALSMQDFEAEVLAAIERSNIRLEDSLALRRLCNERKIPTFNEILLGLPAQTCDSFCRSLVKAVTPYPGDSFFLYLTRLLENAPMALPEQRARHGLETRRCLIGDASRPAEEDWVPEYEEVVVASSAMPVSDWRRAFRFGQALSAFHNLRLLWTAIQVVVRELGGSLQGWLEAILDSAVTAEGGTALSELNALLDGYADAVLEGRAMVLAQEHGGTHLWSPPDAIALLVLRRRDAFYAEVAAATRDWACDLGEDAAELLDDALRFEALCMPGLDRRESVRAELRYDWLAWVRDPTARLARRRVELRHDPPETARWAQSWPHFLLIHTAAMRAKGGALPVVEIPLEI